MPKVKYVSPNGETAKIKIEPGESIMSLAINNMVDGILGECGGAMACATCQCYLDPEYAEFFDEMSEMESEMLELASNRESNSRLSCQLKLTEEIIDDIVVHLPESQM